MSSARRIIALEGMPGTGKTTLAEMLADTGHTVLGEYTDSRGAPLPQQQHPRRDDDDAHQANWLTKHHQLTQAPPGDVYLDRDWLSSLAYAASLPHPHDQALLTRRTAWAAEHLHAGTLAVPHLYLLLSIDTTTSLQRRAHRLAPGHPWSTPAGLDKLAAFYRDPADTIEPINSALARRLRRAAWIHHRADGPIDATLALLHQATALMESR